MDFRGKTKENETMNKSEKIRKAPMAPEKIYKLMVILVYLVSSVYLIKNIVGKSMTGIIALVVCLAAFTAINVVMKLAKAAPQKKYMAVSLSIMVVVFFVSISSGAYYSDDYGLYIAVMGLGALFLEPAITTIQAFIIPVLLVVQYIIHPDRVESRSQFIMCLAIFILGAYIINLLVKRGKAYIDISEEKAEEANDLIGSMKNIGAQLHVNMQNNSERFKDLEEVNEKLSGNALQLQKGSDMMRQGTQVVAEVCGEVQDKIQTTERQIEALNDEVGSCERAIADNRKGIDHLSSCLVSAQNAMEETNEVFRTLSQQMEEIAEVIQQMNKIASNTTMLALNASIEAARAGTMGSGFAVVASKVQDLAVDSNKCSAQVQEVLSAMQTQIEHTTSQMSESTEEINDSLEAIKAIDKEFDCLTERFVALYENIAEQNINIGDVEVIFDGLKDKIVKMNEFSESNQRMVEEITNFMDVYNNNVREVVDDSKKVTETSEEMLGAVIK